MTDDNVNGSKNYQVLYRSEEIRFDPKFFSFFWWNWVKEIFRYKTYPKTLIMTVSTPTKRLICHVGNRLAVRFPFHLFRVKTRRTPNPISSISWVWDYGFCISGKFVLLGMDHNLSRQEFSLYERTKPVAIFFIGVKRRRVTKLPGVSVSILE